ncbi:MAG: hypothetical protein ACI9JN_002467 [Bacteroidia bacterium]|jgi:hypothetical protein
MRHGILSILTVIILTGCFEKDEPIQPFPRGEVEQITLEVGPKYTHQLFYNFAQNEVVKSVLRNEWDIAFTSLSNNNSIYLNTGNTIYGAISDKKEMSEVNDTVGLEFKWDWSNGRDDSTVLYNWEKNNTVAVFDLGYDLSNVHQGFVKVKFNMQNDSLVIQYGFIGQRTERTVIIGKDDRYNRVYFSFTKGEQVNIEPVKTSYDLIFRQYIYYFQAEVLSYSVVGALYNPTNTKVMSITDKDFSDISLSDTANYTFSANHDVVGYDWKSFNIDEGVYIVYPDKNFIIQTAEGFFYKFHFVDFYNSSGERGYPKMESKLL